MIKKPELNITPFVDIMLVLLAILMVSVTATTYEEKNVNLPEGSKTKTAIKKAKIEIVIQKDKTILKKILGTYDPNSLDVEDLNKISEFMFVKDNDGKVIGLSEAFFSLINGLGYVNK